MGVSFTIAAGPRQRSHSRVRVPRDSRPYFTVPDSRLLQPGGPGPYIHIPQEQGGPVIPQALGSLFIASYDSQDYGGGIVTRLSTGVTRLSQLSSSLTPLHGRSREHSVQQHLYCCMLIRCSGNAFTEQFPRNERCFKPIR
jgi:hypothetical protein